LSRAFRRPAEETDIASYLVLFHAALNQGQTFEDAVFFTVRSALVSPNFLFLTEPPNFSPEPRPLDQYALASRLSYFLWGSMPTNCCSTSPPPESFAMPKCCSSSSAACFATIVRSGLPNASSNSGCAHAS
jgi:hypothetical protein